MRDVDLMRVVGIGLGGKERFEQRVEGGEEANPTWDNLPNSHCKTASQVSGVSQKGRWPV